MSYYKDYTSNENKNLVLSDFNPKILQIGFEHNSPGWYNLEHSHKACEIILLLEGKESVVVKSENRYEAGPNDILIFDSDVVHQEFSSSNLVREAIVVTFDGFKINDLPENHLLGKNDNPIIHIDDKNKFVLDLFYKLLDESKSDNLYSYSMACAYLKAIIASVLKDDGKVNKNKLLLNIECEKVKDYIDEHYAEKINLDDLANVVFISKGHLSHIFKSQIGESPIQYLIGKRIEVAKDLLENTNESINNIALKVGYDNQAYFSQFFTNETGMSPAKYRKIKRIM